MAKTVPANTVAEAYAAYSDMVILDGIGPANTKDENGVTIPATTYVAFVDKSCVEYLGELRDYINRNWTTKKCFAHPDGSMMTLDEKLSAIPAIALAFEPSTPKTQSPIDLAIQNILVRMNPLDVQGLSGQALINACAPDVVRFHLQADLSRYQDQIDAEIAAIAASTSKRSVRDGTGAKPTTQGVGMKFETRKEAAE